MTRYLLPFLLLLSGCVSAPQNDLERRLQNDLYEICGKRTNWGRHQAVHAILKRDGHSVRSVPVGGHTLYKVWAVNEPIDHWRKVLYVCHTDATCMVTSLPRKLSYGLLDPILPFFSKGAFDAGGAVAVCLELARLGCWVAFLPLEESESTFLPGLFMTGADAYSNWAPNPKALISIYLVGGAAPSRADVLSFFGTGDQLAWKGKRVYGMAGPPFGYRLDQFAAVTTGYPLFRYHGILDRPGFVEPRWLAAAVRSAYAVSEWDDEDFDRIPD